MSNILDESIKRMTNEISAVLSNTDPSIYLYGSVVLDDFRLGWSDIDILCLTKKAITQEQAEKLVGLRQKLLEDEADNKYYRSFEGGMLTLNAFVNHTPDRVVYWGTSGQRITDNYNFDSFSMVELLENGLLLYGDDVREQMEMPAYHALYSDVKRHYEAIRKYAQTVGKSIYSFGWLLDTARCIYTLYTGKITAKTKAGEWALENNLCPVPDALKKAVTIRKNPLRYKNDIAVLDYAGTLGSVIQQFAYVLEKELIARENLSVHEILNSWSETN